MKRKILKFNKIILVSMATLLGFSACKKDEPELMYGVIPDKYHCVPMADESLSQEASQIQDIVIVAKNED